MNLTTLSQARPLVVPRDGLQRPLVIPPGGGKPKALTRTTTFIDCLEDKSSIADWKMRGVLYGAGKVPQFAEQARSLDPEKDKDELMKLAQSAFAASGFDAKKDKGTELHELSELVDQGQALPSQRSIEDMRDMAAYSLMTADLEVTRIEQFVVVHELGVGGTLDRTVRYSGIGPDGEHIEGEFIGDVKTGKLVYENENKKTGKVTKTIYGGLKIAAQEACYAHGELYDYSKYPVNAKDKAALDAWKKVEHPDLGAYSPLPGINQDWGITIHLPSGKAAGGLYWTDLKLGWEAAQLALVIRKIRSNSKSALAPFLG